MRNRLRFAWLRFRVALGERRLKSTEDPDGHVGWQEAAKILAILTPVEQRDFFVRMYLEEQKQGLLDDDERDTLHALLNMDTSLKLEITPDGVLRIPVLEVID